MLECEVANLAGQVQWTKDGFALGKIYVFLLQSYIVYVNMTNALDDFLYHFCYERE